MSAIRRPKFFETAGYESSYVVAIVDAMRRPTRILSGQFETLADAENVLRWVKRRHRSARVVRRLVFLDVLP